MSSRAKDTIRIQEEERLVNGDPAFPTSYVLLIGIFPSGFRSEQVIFSDPPFCLCLRSQVCSAARHSWSSFWRTPEMQTAFGG